MQKHHVSGVPDISAIYLTVDPVLDFPTSVPSLGYLLTSFSVIAFVGHPGLRVSIN